MANKHTSVKAVTTRKLTPLGCFWNIGLSQCIDGASDVLFRDALSLELMSSEHGPNLGTTSEKKPVKSNAKLNVTKTDEAKYVAQFQVPENFAEHGFGAILVTSEHRKEMYLKDIVLDGLPEGFVRIICESWIQPKSVNPEKRIFFFHKACLPSQTPLGLKGLREKELQNIRGNGQGERKPSDRIYDYDTYNDLGDPDNKPELRRPVLGTKEHPYPRRCRTGRPPCRTDPLSETRSSNFYVPRDEDFADLKRATFTINLLSNALRGVIPALEGKFVDENKGFPNFKKIEELFNIGIQLPNMKNKRSMTQMLPDLFETKGILQFPTPDVKDRDEFAWFSDEEFARETLAGINPFSIKLVTEWPITSKLDPKIYGPPESAISRQLIEQEIKGIMSVNEVVEQKKLFIMDYHDLLLPYVNKVRQIEGTTLYGSRTLFFLTSQGTLKPIAIELTRPPTDDGQKPQWKQVYTPSGDAHATKTWLWRLAKAHVLAHDSGYHQLISHWLRTHCCTEPYIIATNRQLSAMHPINILMNPYFRYTMEINTLARQQLINADGIIEKSFSTGKYSMEISSAVYGQDWKFDQQALPADLINRGMAVEDPLYPHGLKLTIEDYPFANDGLILWGAIEQWVTEYVSYYYPESTHVESDQELQAWWEEIRYEGHKDKKDEKGWPTLKTPSDLNGILTTMIWVSSGHHAAVNFGQYTFAGYFPNRPTIARIKMPTEDPTEEEWKNFLEKPHAVLLQTFPSQFQAIEVMVVLDVLSTHSPDEEYIGEIIEPSWEKDPTVKAAFERFSEKLKELENVIEARNADVKLKNRNGAGILPYQLLKPSSKPGVTTMGVPNSISI